MIDRSRVFGERGSAVERIAPGFFPNLLDVEAEHIARYQWAAKRVRHGRVLDVACGTGYGAVLLRDGGARWVASLEYSLDALRFGRNRYGLEAIRADAHHLPFGANTFDIVACFETIEHLAGPDSFLLEVRRVLRHSGTLLISTPNARRTNGDNPHHVREYTLHELTVLVARTGLVVERVYGQHWRVAGWVFKNVPGFRRLAFLLERRSLVTRLPVALGEPLYWCLIARKGQ
jgi:SAM-dependent methyltransferase